ncbi:cyanobacterial protein, TIGR03792 family [Nostoc sp. KVJ20]|uniref:TIGR03792 family protein n=1 Tax=unclassified Nostoc TaxID=2593658 RepID=UPI00083E3F29|nr:TIGR03792 family protein [Nostoc sp. KVJ20]ODH00993.1 cyanobacterial protein, TIGR03792 family [Nostoc sp. KVJ20]
MFIELLKFKVASDLREYFIQKDAQIWTTALAEYPGFLGKEVWISPNDYTEVILIIRWATLEQWKAVPQAHLQTIEDNFIQALRESYSIVDSGEYQVRKFPHS